MIIPLIHRIIVRQQKLEEVNSVYKRAKAAGIVLAEHPDKAREEAGVDVGTVIAIGQTAYRDYHIDVPIKVGDVVTFARFSGKTIIDPSDGKEYVALNDEDVVAIITGEQND